jgi:hypothetical protein
MHGLLEPVLQGHEKSGLKTTAPAWPANLLLRVLYGGTFSENP